MRPPRFPLVLLLLLASPLVLFAEEDPWQAAFSFDANKASARFETLHRENLADPAASLAHAAALLARQPRTSGNLQRARDLASNVPPDAPANLHAAAAYLLARLDHDHLSPPNLVAARAAYEALLTQHPGHPLSDRAAVHLAVMLLHQTPELNSFEAIAKVESLIERIQRPSARRELLHLVARAYLDLLNSPADALPPLLAARAIGFDTPNRNGDLDLMIASLASETGDEALAARHYTAFAEAYPRDVRATTARRLAREAATKAQP